jgi:sortase B
LAKNEDNNVAGNDIDSIIDGLDLDELSKKYGVEPDDTHAELSAREPEANTQSEPPAEQDPVAETQSKFLDLLGTLLLLFSLVIFGVPMMIGKVKRQFSAAVCIILSVVIVFCSYSVFGSYRSAAASVNTDTSPAQTTESPVLAKPPLLPESVSALKPNTGNAALPEGILEKYKTVYTFNQDIIGWLKIPNTSIDTIVTQGKDNSHYLKTDIYGKYTRYGNAFLDYRDNPKELSQNSIIYGHTTDTGLQVFNDLYKYMDYNFYINNPIIEFGTLYKDYEWKVFSVYITNVESIDDNDYFFYYIYPEINDSKFPGYLSQIIQRSRFFSDIGVDENDKILTLSTCVYDNDYPGNHIDSRLVVAARLLRAGESKETDTSTVIDNPNYRRPQAWYSHFGLKNPYANSEKWSQ